MTLTKQLQKVKAKSSRKPLLDKKQELVYDESDLSPYY